ncbi:hypothetical protein RYH73_08000 [Olivibacter sp. CPCC 100613]|uniref:hypothetical protein n=1 Tax=Olivibacter sp. CPCC 100613 TaxID=3079931 RepID=UPI00280E57CF
MIFDYPGYELQFIQKRRIKDGSAHLFSFLYKFYSPVTDLQYVLTADYHEGDFFAIKFYAKMHRKSDFKYYLITNRGDVGNLLVTCLKCVPLLLGEYPTASFGFVGSRTYDKNSRKMEGYSNTQRFKIYREFVSKKIGTGLFQHFEYEEVSGYLLINQKCGVDPNIKERQLVSMLAATYNDLPNP